MKNKRVKQMMADVFNGEWINYNSKGFYYANGMSLHVFGVWLGKRRPMGALHKAVSLTASELKGE